MGIGLLWFVAQQFLGTWLGDQPWWKAFSSGWVLVCIGSLFVGAVWAESRYPGSELRQWWSKRSKCFEVEACFLSQEHAPHDHFSLICLMRFTRDVRNEELRVRVLYSHPQDSLPVLTHVEMVSSQKDAQRRLRLGSFNIPRAAAPARHSEATLHAVMSEPERTDEALAR
ncbi:MAG: hypothetical protein EOP21_02840 [Hyphomicrobiales bacterium]|nr:MAG: hypothetical protein EOP21_02840 [Hyphomicrobiales bacterium]